MNHSQRIFQQIFAATILVFVAAFLRFGLLRNMGVELPYITFYPAVAIAALYGGRISGVLATFLSVMFVYFWQSANNPSLQSLTHLQGMIIFTATGFIIAGVSESMFRAQARAARAEELARIENEHVHESKLTEQKIEASERKFRELFENSPIGMAAVDPRTGLFIQANLIAQEIYGYSEEELKSKTVDELTHPDDRAQSRRFNSQLATGLIDKHFVEKRYLRKDGSSFWAQSSISIIKNLDGGVERFIGSFIDITERKRNEQLLQQWSNAFNYSVLGIALGDAVTQKIMAANPAFAKMLGYTVEELTELLLFDVYARHEHERVKKIISEAYEHGRIRYESFMLRKDGSEFPVQVDLAAVNDENGQPLYRVATVQDITERRQTSAALQESEQTYRSLFENMLNGFAYCQMLFENDQPQDFIYLIVNSAFEKLTGLKDVAGKKVSEVIPGIREAAHDLIEKYGRVASTAIPESFEYFVEPLQMWFSISVYSPKRGYFVAIFDVITERKNMEDSLRKLSLAVEQSPSSIVITDLDANIVYANVTYTKQTGYLLGEVVGKNPRFMQSGKTPRQAYIELWQQLSLGEIWKGEFVNHRKDGSEYIESVLISPVRDNDGRITNYLAIKDDITDKKRAEERIENLAHFDQLTGLPNNTMLEDHFKYALSLAQRSDENLAVMFMDLDHFKNINDTLGHSIGDQLLMEVAKRLKAALREEDTVSRLGGDEFIFILPGTDANGAAHVAQKLLASVSAPCQIEKHELISTSSIGITIYPDDGQDMETLSKNADAAMYQVKQTGRNGYRFFTQAMQANSARNLMLSNALRHALKNNQLKLLYQPQVSMQDGHIIGAEALLRWQHPELGNITPAEFIPIAEETGLIIEIGEWVLRTAAMQLKNWTDQGLPKMVMAVNLSAVQFRQANLIQMVTAIIAEVGLLPNQLELELTEAVAMDDPLSAIAVMDQLFENGVSMSIDDFGTGYSSLSYLKRFKVYKLKIDQSFVRDISDDPDDKAIVTAIINMASSLGMRTIAEGVETSSQLAFLRLQGCDEAQGYYFSKPLPADEFETYARSLT